MSKKKNQEKSNLLNVADAAKFLGVSEGTIHRWSQSKQLHGIKIGIRGDWRFDVDELLTMTNAVGTSKKHQAPLNVEGEPHLHEHFVQFYEQEEFFLDSLSDYINHGLSSGEVCIVIATGEHLKKINSRIKAYGLSPTACQKEGFYYPLDAEDTLHLISRGKTPDPKRCYEVIGNLLKRVKLYSAQVRVFGEMVALLWEQGNEKEALQLEKIWNNLSKSFSFSLLCAYPMHCFGKETDILGFSQIGDLHTHVIPAESYTKLKNERDRLRAISILQQKNEVLTTKLNYLKGGLVL